MAAKIIFLLAILSLVAGCVESDLRVKDSATHSDHLRTAEIGPEGVNTSGTLSGEQKVAPKVPVSKDFDWANLNQAGPESFEKMEVTAHRQKKYGILGTSRGFKLFDGPYMGSKASKGKREMMLWSEDGYVGWMVIKIGNFDVVGIDFRTLRERMRLLENPFPITVKSIFGKEEVLQAYPDDEFR